MDVMKEHGYICLRLSILLIAALTIIVYTSVPRMLLSQEVVDETETVTEESSSADGSSGTAMGSVQKAGPVTSCGYNIRDGETDMESGADGEVEVDAVEASSSEELSLDGETEVEQVSSRCSAENAQEDADADGVINCEDNCPSDPNPNQADGNNDGFGDICEIEKQKMCNRGMLSDDQCQ